MGLFEDAQREVQAEHWRQADEASRQRDAEALHRRAEEDAAREYVDAMQWLGISPGNHDFLASEAVKIDGRQVWYLYRTGQTVFGWSTDDPTQSVRGLDRGAARSDAKRRAKGGGCGPDLQVRLGIHTAIVITPNGLACKLTPHSELGFGYKNAAGVSYAIVPPWHFYSIAGSFGGGGTHYLSEALKVSLMSVLHRRGGPLK